MKPSLLAVLLRIATATTAQVVSTGRTVSVGGIHYFVPPWCVGTISGAPVAEGDALLPVTVVNTKSASLNGSALSQITKDFLTNDDVIQNEFLKGVLHVYYIFNYADHCKWCT